MNNHIFISALFLSIGSNMLISFSHYLRLMKEQPLKVAFMFGKVIPPIYEKIPYHPLAIKYNIISYILFFGTPVVDFYFNTWWSAITIFTLGRILGTSITRFFIDNISYYNSILMYNLIAVIIFLTILFHQLTQI